MQWIKKHVGHGEDTGKQEQAPFIIGSDKWMGSTAQQNQNQSPGSSGPPQETSELSPSSPPESGNSPVTGSQSVGDAGTNTENPEVTQYTPESGSKNTATNRPSNYPEIYQGGAAEVNNDQAVGSTTDALKELSVDREKEGGKGEVESSAEVLVKIGGAIVHLIDEQESPHLVTGDFSVIRINQQGNGIVVFIHVGDSLSWPVMKDSPTVKLDPTHYFFTLPVPPAVDEVEIDGNGGSGKTKDSHSPEEIETLNYGVTFPVSGQEKALAELDKILEQYSFFSSPSLVHGDKNRDELVKRAQEAGEKAGVEAESPYIVPKDQKVPSAIEGPHDDFGGMVLPPEMVSSDGKKITEQNQSNFWTTMAPNVDDYGTSTARGIATGSGHIIKGIFWVRDSTVAQLESGSIYMKSKIKPKDKPSQISPRTLRNLHRVRKMSRATDHVAKSVLTGVVLTTGFFMGSVISSKAGKKFFKLLPGEVALVSLDAFGMLFDAVEKATTDVLESTSFMTQNIVAHRYGESAGQVTEETIATAGHLVSTVWTVAKLRKALMPEDGVTKLTKTGMVKAAAKSVFTGGKSK